nr:Ycf35 [Echinothamnion sp.]
MSHFSKIKTNITNLNVLIRTIQELGFNYRFVSNIDTSLLTSNQNIPNNILVYKVSQCSKESHLFTFTWNIDEYILLVDLDLCNLDVNFNYLLDRLFQQYAYNIVINTSVNSGFKKITENSVYDGSVKLTLQRWNSN